jgi:uncharacterized protein (UPF0218 family)
MVDSDIKDEGLISNRLEVYNSKTLRKLLFNKFKDTSQSTIDLLKDRGYLRDEALDCIIKHPEKHVVER